MSAHQPQNDPDQQKRPVTSLTGWTILIVDDVEDNVEMLKTILEMNGAIVHKAFGGAEGIELALDIRPDLILLDLAMPEVDGYMMIHILKNTSQIADIPVIAISAHQSAIDHGKTEGMGFNGLIGKPYSVQTLISEICEML